MLATETKVISDVSMWHDIDFTVGVSFSVGGRVISYGYDRNVIFHVAWACRQLSAIYFGKQHLKLFPAVVRTDMTAACKYCVVIAVAVSAIFLSSQQADAQ